jgi:hypothetical protein
VRDLKTLLLRKISAAAVMVIVWSGVARAQAPSTQPTTETTRRDFLAMIDRPRVPLAAKITPQGVQDGMARFRFTFDSEADQHIPGMLLVRSELETDSQHHPVVIVLHGTGGKKEEQIDTLLALAGKGFIAVAIDARYHGERGSQADYNAAIARAYADGKSHPLYYDEVWDMMRLIDYLQTRPDVDPHRIGMMGISKGGIETWLTAAADTRVSVAIPCISVQSFEWGLTHDGWHGRISTVQKGFNSVAKTEGITKPDSAFVQKFYDHLLPGIYTRFDGPQMLPLIAPRPLLVISGDKDPMNPVPGLQLCEQATRPAYAEHPERFSVLLQPNTAHAVKTDAHAAAVNWFVRWLMP